METVINGHKLILKIGDITKEPTQAIVNAANTSLLGGGGVDGAIHRAAGRGLLNECIEIRNRQGGCPVGQAVLTKGYNLPAKYVIHTVGPAYVDGTHGEAKLLASAYAKSLELAKNHEIRSISFPSISTGIYRFPIIDASTIALTTIVEFLENQTIVSEFQMILFTEHDYHVYSETLKKLTN